MTRKIVYILLWLSMSVAILYFTHLTGFETLDRVILPVYFIVILATLIHGAFVGIIVGTLSPVLSFFATRIPSESFIFIRAIELVILAIFCFVWMKKVKNLRLVIMLTFFSTRIVLFLVEFTQFSLYTVFKDTLYGLIGLGLQLFFIPTIYRILVKSIEIEN